MVCVNSTSATLALAAGSPVCTLGDAIYNVPGLTFARHLDEFWSNPQSRNPVSTAHSAGSLSIAALCVVDWRANLR